MTGGYRTVRLGQDVPQVDPSAWVAPDVTLAGDVRVNAEASVWYASVLRGDGDRIEIGAGSNVQDGSVVHADPGFPVVLGAGVTIGHRVVLHGCRVEDDVLVGMGAVVMDGARIGRGSLVAAGALVPEGMVVPPGSLVAGVPGRVRRETTEEERQAIIANAETYRHLRLRHATALG